MDSVRVTVPDVTVELPKIKDDPDRARQLVRLDLRVILNQGDGTFVATNRIADEAAQLIVRTLRQERVVVDER